MRVELTELLRLDEDEVLSLDELASRSGLSAEELLALVEHGALEPVDAAAETLVFTSTCVIPARVAGRLKHDFQLDSSGLAVALALLERIRELERQLQQMQAQLPRRHG